MAGRYYSLRVLFAMGLIYAMILVNAEPEPPAWHGAILAVVIMLGAAGWNDD